MRMSRGQMQQRAAFEPLPVTAKEEVTGTTDYLHQRSSSTRVGSQLLSGVEGEKDGAKFSRLYDRAADNARGRYLRRVRQREGLRRVGRDQ